VGGMARLSDIGNMARNLSKPPEGQSWYRIVDKADTSVEVYIYDEIGFWGITAAEFVKDLQAVKGREMDLRLNTPGGEVFDGVAIYNAVRRHAGDATVTVYVDGIAASAGSFIAMAASPISKDKKKGGVRMSRKAQMMIHDARGLAIGNATDMQEMADLLNRQSDIIASIYADRAGGTVEEWRVVMQDERWYTDQEAVDAGLADMIVEDSVVEEDAVQDRFANAIFNVAGREASPPPNVLEAEKPYPSSVRRTVVNIDVKGDPKKIGKQVVDAIKSAYTKEKEAGVDPVKLRESLGLDADAPDEAVTEALAAEGLTNKIPTMTQLPSLKDMPEGAVIMDSSVVVALQQSADEGKQAAAWLKEQQMTGILDQAVRDGKFPPARRQHWENMYKMDPEGTRKYIDNMAPGLLPTQTIGYAGTADEARDNQLYASMYPKGGE